MQLYRGAASRLHGLHAVIGRDVGRAPPRREVPVIKDIINSACRLDARERRPIHTCEHVPCRVHGTYPTTTTRTTTKTTKTTKTTTVGNHNEWITSFTSLQNSRTIAIRTLFKKQASKMFISIYQCFACEFIIEATTFHGNKYKLNIDIKN